MFSGGFAATLCLELRNLISWKGSECRDGGCDTGLVRAPGWVLWLWPPAGNDSFPCIRRSSASIWSVPFGMLWEINFFHCVSVSHIIFSSSVTAPADGITTSALSLGNSSHIPARNLSLPSAALASSPLQSLTGGPYGCCCFPFFMAFSTLLVATGQSYHAPLDEITAPGLVLCFLGFIYLFVCLFIWHMLFLPSQICRPASVPCFVQLACFKGVPLALCFQASSCQVLTYAFS